MPSESLLWPCRWYFQYAAFRQAHNGPGNGGLRFESYLGAGGSVASARRCGDAGKAIEINCRTARSALPLLGHADRIPARKESMDRGLPRTRNKSLPDLKQLATVVRGDMPNNSSRARFAESVTPSFRIGIAFEHQWTSCLYPCRLYRTAKGMSAPWGT